MAWDAPVLQRYDGKIRIIESDDPAMIGRDVVKVDRPMCDRLHPEVGGCIREAGHDGMCWHAAPELRNAGSVWSPVPVVRFDRGECA